MGVIYLITHEVFLYEDNTQIWKLGSIQRKPPMALLVLTQEINALVDCFHACAMSLSCLSNGRLLKMTIIKKANKIRLKVTAGAEDLTSLMTL